MNFEFFAVLSFTCATEMAAIIISWLGGGRTSATAEKHLVTAEKKWSLSGALPYYLILQLYYCRALKIVSYYSKSKSA